MSYSGGVSVILLKPGADFPKNEKWINEALKGILSDHP